jgi:hypothetical protein
MTDHGPVAPIGQDPTTVIALIYRIVDQPRRAFTLAVLLLPFLAVVTQITAPTATLVGIPDPSILVGRDWNVGVRLAHADDHALVRASDRQEIDPNPGSARAVTERTAGAESPLLVDLKVSNACNLCSCREYSALAGRKECLWLHVQNWLIGTRARS